MVKSYKLDQDLMCNNMSSGMSTSFTLSDIDPDDGDKNGVPCKNGTSSLEISPKHTLRIQGLAVSVKTWHGSWWCCGCCRRYDKPILSGINLTASSGQLVAFIGNSGSGKTSLLNVISSRHNGSVIGSVLLDNKELTYQRFCNKAGYVIQDDRLLALLTVRETLMYTAKLKFCSKMTNEQIESKMSRCLRQMSLTHVADTLVGDAVVRGLSGGEKRRLSVAVQLLQDPDVLLLDEPTTGLDSYTSHYLVQTLASLAHQENKIIIMSIHQPRSDIFRLLDTVGILSGGQMVFYGARQELVPYFTKLGHPCPFYANPLDFYIDLCSVDHRSEHREVASKQRVQQLHHLYSQSRIYAQFQTELQSKQQNSRKNNISDGYYQENGTSTNTDDSKEHEHVWFRCRRFFSKIGVHLNRMFLYQWRDKVGFFNRIFTFMTFAFLNWLILGKLELNIKSIQDRIGIFYQTASFSCTVPIITSAVIFPYHRNLYYRESGDGLYNCVHFLVAYFTHVLPFHIMSGVLFATWMYWACGLYPDVFRFFIYTVVVVIHQHLGELQAVACWGIFSDPSVGQAVSTLIIAISTMYASGFLKGTTELIAPLQYTTYINHFKYAAEVLAANELVGLEFDCSAEPYASPNCTLPGEYVLDSLLPTAEENFVLNLCVLAVMVVCYWLLVTLVFVARGRRVLH